MLVSECTGVIVPRGCNDRSYRDRDQHSVMTAAEKEKDMEDKRTYKEAFDDFDWNKNGTIPTKASFINHNTVHKPRQYFFLYVLCLINKILQLERDKLSLA